MTIRPDSDLDKQILDAIETDRASLDRFASTPNRQLLGALVGPGTTAGLWSMATTKLLTAVLATTFVGAGVYYGMHSLKSDAPELQSAPSMPHVVQSLPPATTVSTPPVFVRNRNEARRKHSSSAQPPQAETSVSTALQQPSAAAPDIDRWNTGKPEEIQMPTKLEVRTKAK